MFASLRPSPFVMLSCGRGLRAGSLLNDCFSFWYLSGAVEQKYFSAKMRFCTQSPAATFTVKIIKRIFLLLAFGDATSLPVTTGAKDSPELFYCTSVGCAADVIKVFCNDTLLQHDLLPDCSGSPLLHKVCQHDGRAYVSTPVGTKCEFEKESDYIPTKKCTDVDPMCLWIHATSSSPTPSNNGKKAVRVHLGYIVLGCILGLAALLVGGGICYCVKRCIRRPNQQHNRY
ncbi:uncharacterized protein LOC122828421 isoform X2 [Gambusia affinis]|uniref:uncharacterized protein LOC122828421 isoform X2 n=1 Tax=Gambusia affinis TaxID=33528 RepID=UPI001CDD7C76|nr:uncharacterized protein LOC122828421 isoform X2 [Gambusia affinis]